MQRDNPNKDNLTTNCFQRSGGKCCILLWLLYKKVLFKKNKWYRDFVFIFAWFESFITSSHQCYFILSLKLYTQLFDFILKIIFEFFFFWKILLISLLISESSKTPSWIGTSNRQYLLPKHEMLYSNVSPKTKNFRENNRIKMFPRFLKTKIWLCILCAPSFSIYILWCTYYIGSYYLLFRYNELSAKQNIKKNWYVV